MIYIRSITMTLGVTRPIVAIREPGMPAVVKPTYVAILTPIGPGVDSETATISASCAVVNPPVFADIA